MFGPVLFAFFLTFIPFFSPLSYDFYLISQVACRGTVNPTYYNVIYDDNGLKPDHMQRLTFKLCHLYYNWPGLISIPAPCQYAHKLTFLVAQSIHKEPSLELANSLFYLWWHKPLAPLDEESKSTNLPWTLDRGCDWGKEIELSFNFWKEKNKAKQLNLKMFKRNVCCVVLKSYMLRVNSHCGIWN